MAAYESLPKFYFRVQQLRAGNFVVRANADHAWLPPRALGASAIVEEDQTPFNTDFCYDDQDAAVHPISSGLPDHLTEQAYQCYSLYVGRDGEVFVLNYNAHERSVWNGTDLGDDNSDHVDGGDLSGDWCTLSFRHLVDSSMSDASYDAPEASIIGRRPGQVWVDELLPQLYHGNRAFSDEGSEGGLVGDIALLIGLIALSIPTPSTGTMLPGLIQHYWIPVPAAVPALRASALQARIQERGVMITIWLENPESVPLMEACQRGAHGPLFT